jgi:hypothetical protein
MKHYFKQEEQTFKYIRNVSLITFLPKYYGKCREFKIVSIHALKDLFRISIVFHVIFKGQISSNLTKIKTKQHCHSNAFQMKYLTESDDLNRM